MLRALVPKYKHHGINFVGGFSIVKYCIFGPFTSRYYNGYSVPSSIAEHTAVADRHDSVPNGEDNERYCGCP